VSTRALRTSEPRAATAGLRYLDFAVLALALPVFLAAGLALLGWGALAAAWLAQRGIHALVTRRARDAQDPRGATALLAASMFGRIWLVALAIFAAGMVEREAGLSAAVLAIALMTTYLIGVMTTRPFEAPGARR
jgi:hypothetical protein